MSEYRRATRPADRRVVGGVATGLADHFAVPVWWVQVAFVVAAWMHGAGIVAYLLLWRFMPLRPPEESPGIEAASRSGMRQSAGPEHREVVRSIALLVVAAGGLWLVATVSVGFGSSLVIPVLLAVTGVTIVWRSFDDATMSDWLRRTRGVGYWLRMGAGLALVIAALAYFVGRGSGWTEALDVIAAVLAVIIGLGLLFGPWVAGLVVALGEERRQRIRSQERADMAAHLHDSVLQTLSLLQRNAEDPATVSTLARRQERELRSWLFGEDATHSESLATALRAVASDVELLHKVRVEPVIVGDGDVGDAARALLLAVREALVNAARHSGADRVDLYAEITDRSAEVFVRDRGTGFALDAVPADRQGIRGSIAERLDRHGGTSEVRSALGAGTEVRMTITWDAEHHE